MGGCGVVGSGDKGVWGEGLAGGGWLRRVDWNRLTVTHFKSLPIKIYLFI